MAKPYRAWLAVIVPLGLLLVLLQSQLPSKDVGHRLRAATRGESPVEVDVVPNAEKQRGAHVFGIDDSTDFMPLKENNLDWVTLVCWGFQRDFDSPTVGHHNGDSAYMLRHDSAWQKRIEQVRAGGFNVFFKPHVWIDHPTEGTWRADIYPTNEANWQAWQDSYRDFILRYAKVAERAQAEMFCIGTEFSRLTTEKPEFWKDIIRSVREVYTGKITYAANWYDEFEEIPFWEDLDYIGIQAYFPLAKNQNPSLDQVTRGWQKHLPAMASVSKKHQRPILFTEMGYRSTTNSAIAPWTWVEESCGVDSLFSAETQANCYQAFFNTVWHQGWFAGVHIWQWRSDFGGAPPGFRFDFTPQGKPAQAVLAKGFE